MAEQKTKAVHFSDGEKAVCGGKTGTAVKDEQKVTCSKCKGFLATKAKEEGDPLIKVRVKNMDIPDGTDFVFCFGRQKDNPKRMQGYHLVNNAVHMLPKSVIEHLRSCVYPYKRYVPDQEEGHSMQVAGRYHRFVIQELES